MQTVAVYSYRFCAKVPEACERSIQDDNDRQETWLESNHNVEGEDEPFLDGRDKYFRNVLHKNGRGLQKLNYIELSQVASTQLDIIFNNASFLDDAKNLVSYDVVSHLQSGSFSWMHKQKRIGTTYLRFIIFR